MFIKDKKLTDDEIIENVRLELIAKLEFILKDLKGEVSDEPKNYFDHTFIYIYESSYWRKFEYKKQIVKNVQIEFEYTKHFKK